MNREQIAKDLGRKIADRLQEQLQREVNLAQHLLQPVHIVAMLSELAAGMANAAALVACQVRKESVSAEHVHDAVLRDVLERARLMRDSGLAEVARMKGAEA